MSPEEREFLHQTSMPLRTVNRALVLYVTLLAGFWGGHKFLLDAKREGWLYLLLSWTSLPLWASLGDFVDLVRQPTIGQGFLKRRLLKRHAADADVIERATWLQLGRVTLLFAIFVGFTAWMMSRMNDGHERVGLLCKQIPVGMSAQALGEFARARDLQASSLREGINVLRDAATLGRHSCLVRLEAGYVTESTHYFMD